MTSASGPPDHVPGSTHAAPGPYVPGSTQAAPPPGTTGRSPTGRGTANLGQPGRRLGPYVVEKELGRGGMGVVLVVRHPDVPRPLALKLILGDADPQALHRFGQEAQVMARVRHPNVVVVHELGRAPEGPYLVTELVEGTGLDRRLREGPLPPREAATLLRALADGLAACHAAGVVHRDLKPANVMLRPDGSPVLLDFGIARDQTAERMTRTGQLIGTPAYMAPEQAEGDKSLDARVDVYGLGAILFECLSGRSPFPQDGPPMAIIKRVLLEEPVWPRVTRPEVPIALEEVLRVAMAKAREARHASAAALRQDLDRFLRGEATWATTQVPRARSRVWIGLVALGLALVVGTGLLLLARRRGATVGGADPAPTASARRPTAPPPPDALKRLLDDTDHLAPDARRCALLVWCRDHPDEPRRERVAAALRTLESPRPVWSFKFTHKLGRGAWLRFAPGGDLLLLNETGAFLRFELGSDPSPPERDPGPPLVETSTSSVASSTYVAGFELAGEQLVVARNVVPRAPEDGQPTLDWVAELLLVDPRPGAKPRPLTTLPFGVVCLAVSPDGQRVCAGGSRQPSKSGSRGAAALVRLADGSHLRSWDTDERVNRVTFALDGACLLAGCGGMFEIQPGAELTGRGLWAWSVGGAEARWHTEGTEGAVSALALTGDRLALGTSTQFIRFASPSALLADQEPLETETLLGRDAKGNQVRLGGAKMSAHTDGLCDLVARGDTLWSVSIADWPKVGPPAGELRRWSIATRQALPLPGAMAFNKAAPLAIALSPDGRLLAVVRAMGHAVEVWDTLALDSP